uniref:Turripeptide Gsg9.1 n=1 Tax=Gemmula sogodensis TaxID=439591 RepID=C91_GEMSO|nr:RecName: Full=Turripeptide Gsg9.1; Flags: Precursor [Gemmula sogodensis]
MMAKLMITVMTVFFLSLQQGADGLFERWRKNQMAASRIMGNLITARLDPPGYCTHKICYEDGECNQWCTAGCNPDTGKCDTT